MDIVAPLAKTGVISEAANLWMAIPIGFIFGFGLYHGGFTDSRKIARAFFLKDVDVPVVVLSAIVTGMLGLWLLSLLGFIDTSKMYYLPTYLKPMAVGGLLFGIGMVIGGFCPGTAVASVATGRVDALVFVLGFFGGSILFGDLFPIWGDYYNSDYRGVYRLDELLGMELGPMVLVVVIVAIAASLFMRLAQHVAWHKQPAASLLAVAMRRYDKWLVLLALIIAGGMALFPTDGYLRRSETPWYIVQRQAAGTRAEEAPEPAPIARPPGDEGC